MRRTFRLLQFSDRDCERWDHRSRAMMFSLGGMIAGALLAEYVFQPEVLSATKRSGESEAKFASLIHGAVWTGLVVAGALAEADGAFFAGLRIQSDWWMLVVIGVLALAHHAIDCTSIRDGAMRVIRVPGLERSMGQIQAVEASLAAEGKGPDPGWIVATLTYGIVGDKMFDLATHIALVCIAWQVAERISGL
jgi:hypothetical protein